MAGPSFNWNQYQTQNAGVNGTTGQPYQPLQGSVDPTAGTIAPGGAAFNAPADPSRTMDPSQTAPSSPMAPTGSQGGAIPPGYVLQNAPGGDTPGSNWGYAPSSGSPTSFPLGQSNGTGITGATDPQSYFNSIFPGSSLSPQDLAAHEADLKAHGITLIRNAAGQPSKIQLADGTVIDPIIGAGSGQNQKAWNVVAGPGGAPTGGGMGTLNQFGQGSGFMTAPIGQFTPPTAQDALNSPGSQYAIDEAMRTMQNSAAAKGSLLNGRVLQGENNAILNQAAGQYGDVFNRALQTYGTNYQTQTGNQDRPFNKYLQLGQLGQTAAAVS